MSYQRLISVIMHKVMNKSGSYSYCKFNRESELLSEVNMIGR